MGRLYSFKDQLFIDLANVFRNKFSARVGASQLSLTNMLNLVNEQLVISKDTFEGAKPAKYFNKTVGTISDFTFSDNDCLRKVVLPAVKYIEDSAFLNCVALNTIDLYHTRWIGHNAFANCASLTSLSGDYVVATGSNAFENCSRLSLVKFPMCRHLGDSSFNTVSNCAIHIGSSLTIDNEAFKGAAQLTLKILDDDNIVELQQPSYISNITYVYVPSAVYSSYLLDSVWSLCSDKIMSY